MKTLKVLTQASLNREENQNERVKRILLLMKKTKLTLQTYYKIFSDYLEKVRVQDNEKVNEQIIRSTKMAIKGIFKYQIIIADMEKRLLQE